MSPEVGYSLASVLSTLEQLLAEKDVETGSPDTRITVQPVLPGCGRKPHGPLKRLLGRLLATANAGAGSCHQLGRFTDDFYAMKRRLLERYGEPDGTDWQLIERRCWGCEFCDEDGYGYYAGRAGQCDGKGIYSRKWIPLARTRLGGFVFHTPGMPVYEKPDAEVTIRGTIRHREVKPEDARSAFMVLCLLFDRELFRKCAARFFALELERPW